MTRMLRLFALLVLVAGFMTACGSSEEETTSTEKAEAWVVVQEQNELLQGMRSELAELRSRAEVGFDEDAEDGTSPEELLAQLRAEIDLKVAAVNDGADAFNSVLVGFINQYAGFADEELDDVQSAAIRMKSDEDIELALDYIARGGDYKRAIDILNNALMVDPDYGKLSSELAAAVEARYMDAERFARVEKGMSEEEVRRAIGQVFHRNVRQQADQGITSWLYPKGGGAAAAVYFREAGDALEVYDKNFDAVKTAVERAE